MYKIAPMFGISPQAIWYWMLKYGIPRRAPKLVKRSRLSKELLIKLYIEERMSSSKIARKLGLRSHSAVLHQLIKNGIPRRTLSEARTKHPKKPFSGDLKEKAYLLGLRAGDLSAERNHNLIRIATSSTRAAQLKMFRAVFEKSGHVHVFPTMGHDKREWRMYCDLDPSFSFLLNKPERIPEWILNNTTYFYSFLAGYVDSEGSICIRKVRRNGIRVTLRIASEDRIILSQIASKLREMGFRPYLYLDRKKGSEAPYGKYTRDFYALWLTRKADVISVSKKLLQLCYHSERIHRMKLAQQIEGKHWSDIKNEVHRLR